MKTGVSLHNILCTWGKYLPKQQPDLWPPNMLRTLALCSMESLKVPAGIHYIYESFSSIFVNKT